MLNSKPDYYNDLDKIYLKIWSLLSDGLADRNAQFHIPVFICGSKKEFDGRIIVLRGINDIKKTLWFHSDIRSKKIETLKNNPQASFLFYDKKDFEKAKHIIDCYSKKVQLLGPSGSGQLAKMVNQICIAGLVQGLSEAINFGLNANLKMEDVIEVISKGAAQSWQMDNRYKTMIDDKFEFGFAVDWMRKDLKIALDEAKKNNSPLPIAKIVDGYYEEIQKMGGNRWDTSSLIRRFRKK